MAFTAPVSIIKLLNNTTLRSSIPNFTQVSQKIWKIGVEINLCPSGEYSCHWDNFYVPQTCSVAFYKQLPYWISWKSGKWLGRIVGHRQKETDEETETINILAYKSKKFQQENTINIWYSACLTDPQITHTDHVTWKDIL